MPFPVPPEERTAERSGIALNTNDSGWPVGDPNNEPEPVKDGDGNDPWPNVTSVIAGDVEAESEVQQAEVDTEGPVGATTFTLTVAGQTTAGIEQDASAATVKTALEALSNVAPGDVEVTKKNGRWTIHFLEAGAFGDLQVAPITADGVGVNEVQNVSIDGTPTAGTFTLVFSGQTTANIAYDANAAAVDSALEALSNIGAGDVTCAAGPLPAAVTVTFTAALAEADQPALTVGTDAVDGGNVQIATGTPGKTGPTVVVSTVAGSDA